MTRHPLFQFCYGLSLVFVVPVLFIGLIGIVGMAETWRFTTPVLLYFGSVIGGIVGLIGLIMTARYRGFNDGIPRAAIPRNGAFRVAAVICVSIGVITCVGLLLGIVAYAWAISPPRNLAIQHAGFTTLSWYLLNPPKLIPLLLFAFPFITLAFEGFSNLDDLRKNPKIVDEWSAVLCISALSMTIVLVYHIVLATETFFRF